MRRRENEGKNAAEVVLSFAAPSVSGMTTASERERRPIHYSRLMDKGFAGGQIDSVLNPVDGIRGQMKRAGIEPKDHHRDNRRQIKEMQMVKQQQEEVSSKSPPPGTFP